MTTDTVFDREIDDLLLHVRGLVLVRELRARRGASSTALDAHDREAERLRKELMRRLLAV